MSLRLSGVSHRYGTHPPVLTDVDLEVEAGDTVAIFGASGSGKTTLLSIMGGLLSPTDGTVTVDGLAVKGPLAPGTVSWVFQTINLLGRRTAVENVSLGLHAIGYVPSGVGQRALAMLDEVGLGASADRLAMRLSGGEAQRVGIARALVGRPRYVLADEPTGQLDGSTSDIVARVLFGARPEGTSVIVATHDRLIADHCSRRYALQNGHLVPQG